MKKSLMLMMAAVAVLASCQKENAVNVPKDDVVEATPITFNLTANHSVDTKAVKTDWESGDAIFVFFSNVDAPKHLKMTFDGTSWTSTEYDGATATPGVLDLKNGDTGTMRAVFLPFGSNATVSVSGSNFVFNKTYYAYYSTATLEYTVTDNQVSGEFNMAIPEGYLQLFVPDASATDEAYTLGCDAVIPTGIASISHDGTINESTSSEDMFGYAYGSGDAKGYVFSGKLNTNYGFSFATVGGYYFAKTKISDNTRQDYFVKIQEGRELTSHCAIKLPANNNVAYVSGNNPNHGKWVPVGSGITVRVGKYNVQGQFQHYNDWQTCNYGSTWPEDMGTQLSYSDAFAIGSLPEKSRWEGLIGDATWSLVKIHGKPGRVIQYKLVDGEEAFGFILLPIEGSGYLYYWTHNIDPDNDEYAFIVNSNPWMTVPIFSSVAKTYTHTVRFMGN